MNDPKIRDTLEVVTAEASDTWIYGCSSDPKKMALLRLFMRHSDAYAASAADSNDDGNDGKEEPNLKWFRFFLLKASEHTWGLDGRCNNPAGGDITHWSNAAFESVRASPLFKQQEDAWHEQRDYFRAALDALGSESTLAANIRAEMGALDIMVAAGATPPPSSMQRRQSDTFGSPIVLVPDDGRDGAMQLQVDPASGAIVKLQKAVSHIRFVERIRTPSPGKMQRVRARAGRRAGMCAHTFDGFFKYGFPPAPRSNPTPKHKNL